MGRRLTAVTWRFTPAAVKLKRKVYKSGTLLFFLSLSNIWRGMAKCVNTDQTVWSVFSLFAQVYLHCTRMCIINTVVCYAE